MGADMIGYFLIANKKTAPKILKAAIKDWDKVAGDLASDDPEEKVEGLKPEDTSRILKLAEKLGYADDMWDDQQFSDAEKAAQVLTDIAWLKSGGPNLPSGFRDYASMDLKLKHGTLHIGFAGEMSWGDEPDGWGYRYIRALERLGVAAELWRSATKS